jgi:signal transduction histidine kinase
MSLLVARKLIELHGGKIWSEHGDGGESNLCISLPGPTAQPKVAAAAEETERQ